MALARNRVNINFVLQGSQNASVGWDWQPSAIVTSFGDLLTWGANLCTSLQTNFGTNMSGLRTLLSGQGQITGVTCQYFTGTSLVTGAFAPIGAALLGSGANNAGQQQSLVFSLVSLVAGRSHRGRTFWPALGTTTITSGKLAAPTPATLLTHFQFLLDAVDAAVPAPTTSVRGMRVYSSKLDTITRPSQIRVGDVLDTQRRRTRSLVQSYVSNTY